MPTSKPRSPSWASPPPTTRPSSSQLATPATYFTSVLALWIAVPVQEKWITSANATEAANYVSSGPFILDTWDHNSQIVLKPNPNWSGDVKPTLTEIDMSMTTEPAQGQAAYEAGELDMVLDPERGHPARQGRSGPRHRMVQSTIPQLAITYYTFNDTRPEGADGQQGLPHRADPGDRQEGLHRRDLRRDRRAGQQLRDAGHPGLPEGPRPVSVRPRVGQGAHDDGPGGPRRQGRRGTSAS